MRKKLNGHENGEFSCQGDLKTKELEVNTSVDMLKNEVILTKQNVSVSPQMLTLGVNEN